MKLLDKLFGDSEKNYKFKTTVFFICLTASSIIWLFSKLSDTYTSQISIPIITENIPQEKILLRKTDSILNLNVTDQGFTLLWLKYFNRKKTFQVDLSRIQFAGRDDLFDARISTSDYANDFLDQFNLAGRIASIKPDTIVFSFEHRMYKKVPVVPEINLSFRKQYFAYDTLRLIPDSVTVSGLDRNVSHIDQIKTKPLNYNDVNNSINHSIQLEIPDNITIEDLPSRRVNILLNVEKFTEAKIIIPITSVNSKPGIRVKTFPEEVSVSYIVALKDFRLITPDMFRMQVDLSDIDKLSAKKLEVNPANFPRTVKINRIEPRDVEYLILK